MSVIWGNTAREQLEEYADYIARDNPMAAARWVAKVLAAADLAERFPHMGRAIPEFGDEEARQVVVHSHKLIYRILDEGIEVVKVWHSARLLHKPDLAEEE
jgi:toxin ParE1/3/4